MKVSLKILLVFLALFSVTSAHAKPTGSSLDRLEFLIGDWVGAEGIYGVAGSPLYFSFAFDLQKKVIVQKTHEDHAPVLNHPAYAADGLMIIYLDPVTQKVRADFFNNSGNVLHYTAEVSSDDQAVTFISESDAIGHHFRTTYFKRKDGALGIKAMMAEPGSGDFHSMNERCGLQKMSSGFRRSSLDEPRCLLRFHSAQPISAWSGLAGE
jgi:hypothetical protein